jgi:hypothetical protein
MMIMMTMRVVVAHTVVNTHTHTHTQTLINTHINTHTRTRTRILGRTPLDISQHSQVTDIHTSGAIRKHRLSKPARSQTHAFDLAATVSSPEIILSLT